jgi:ABC-type lipoprotein release transport system permease subunit
MLTLKLAIRGLWRHKIRTIITLAAVVMGHLLFLLFLSMNDGGHEHMIEMGVRQGRAGHVVIQADGYQKSRSVELLITRPQALRKKVAAAAPDARVALRAFGGGLARSSADSVGVMFAGVEPRKEARVSELPHQIVAGVYLDASPQQVAAAEKKPDELWCVQPGNQKNGAVLTRPVVIGVRLAESLRVSLCDKIVINAQGMGSQEAQKFRVVGIFKTGNVDLDAFFVQMRLADTQKLLHLGDGVHQLAAFTESSRYADALERKLQKVARERPGLVVLSWDEAMPELAEFIWLDEASGWVFAFVVVIIIGIGVLNTVLMSVIERTREFGVMRALGTSPWRIVSVVLLEGVFLGVVGLVLGTLLALYPLHYLAETGIDFSEMVGGGAVEAGGVAMTVVKGKLYPSSVVVEMIIIFAMTFLASVYPAVRAAKLKVLRAIQHV